MDLAAVGAFLSGAAAVFGTTWALRKIRKADDEDCEKRLQAFRNGLKEGRK